MYEGFYLDLILVAIAGGLVYRLWTVLGHKHGQESRRRWYFDTRRAATKEELTGKDPADAPSGGASSDDAPSDDAPSRDAPYGGAPSEDAPSVDAPSAAGSSCHHAADKPSDNPALDQILALLPSFDRQQFLQGARSAFKTIVEAFSRGDSTTLRTLVSDEVFERFEEEIESRCQQDSDPLEVREITTCELTQAWIKDRQSHLEVTFVSQQIPAGGEISLTKSLEKSDIWVFSKPLASRDPNWLLAETR